MTRKRISDMIGILVIAGFIVSFLVHFPMWANIALLVLSGVEIYLILKRLTIKSQAPK